MSLRGTDTCAQFQRDDAPVVVQAGESRPKRQRRRGQPTRLTPSVSKTICDMVRRGNYFTIAAKAAGISTDALNQWRKRGADGEQPYADFAAALEQAELDCESILVEKWHDAAPNDWRAARDLLARRFPDRWGRAVEEMPPQQGAGLSITLHLGDEVGEPKPAIELPQTP